MKQKRILFIYYKLFKPGGVAKVMTNLANEFANKGYHVDILLLTNNTYSFYPLDKNITIHHVDMFSHWAWSICEFNVKYLKFIPKIQNINSYISHIGVFLLLKSWLEKNHHQYDTIISCWYKLSKLISFLKNSRKKTIAWEHISHTVGGVFWNKILKNRYRHLNCVVTTNKAGENYYKYINQNTLTIYNMMDDYCESMAMIPYSEKENIILVVARLAPEKNINEFLDIIKIANIPNDWRVIIVGDGTQKKQLLEKSRQENINVEFTGNKEMEDIYSLLKKSKINCLTSTAEALPTILIQAMFCSNALIAYDCKYGPSDIINQNNGFLIPLHNKEQYKNKLEYLIYNEEAIKLLMKSSHKESEKWKKTRIIDQWEKIL